MNKHKFDHSIAKARLAQVAAAAMLATVSAGCAMMPKSSATAAEQSGEANPSPTATAPATAPATGATPSPAPIIPAKAASPLKPFDAVIAQAQRSDGFIPLWREHDKVWLELSPEMLGKPLFLSTILSTGLGESHFLPGLSGQEYIVELNREGDRVQLLAKNLHVRAPKGSPLARALAASYSDSLLAVAPVASAAHPQSQSILIEAAHLFGADIPGALTALEAAYRLPYNLDRGNSYIERAHTDKLGTSITIKAHYLLPKLPVIRPATHGAPTPNPQTEPRPPKVVPDARSLFLGHTYSLMPLPSEAMPPRKADERVGHFTTAFIDLTNELGLDARSHYVNRWRLEKKEPQAALSEPQTPILVVMDSSIPVKYRPALRAGVLEWNKAFERIGFKNAIVIEQRADDAPAGADHRPHIAMRWFVMEGPAALAVGPSQTDPRTGEILQAAVIIPENWVRIGRTSVAETLPKLPEPIPPSQPGTQAAAAACHYAQEALEQLGFGLDLLAARGVLDPMSPQADQFIFDSLKAVTLHEMGHALGLRHNFKASTVPTLAQLRDSAYVDTHGISSSVMDYNPLNLPLQNEPATAYNMTTLGAYDYWAIEYAYAPLAAETQDEQLAAMAQRQSQDPALAYATDEDAMGALDPHVNPFDLGADPLAWYARRLALSRELWARTQSRPLEEGESFALYRRNLTRGLKQYSQVAGLVLKYLGGVSTTRARAHGHASENAHQPAAYGPALFEPIDPRVQREALGLLINEYFAADNFRFDPQFMRRLGVNQLDRLEGNEPQLNTDFNLGAEVLNIQRSVLGPLMSEALAQRLANAEAKVDAQALESLLSYASVQTTLSQAIWSELKAGGHIISMRRNLQREHIKVLATELIKPTANSATADVRAVHRQVAKGLQADLRRALTRGKINAMTRAHLAEALATLTQALEAPLIKTGA